MRTSEKGVLRLLKSGHRLLPTHCGKIFEKFGKGIASLKIVEERLEWHSRTHEDWGAPHNSWIAVNHCRGLLGHDASLLREYRPSLGVPNARHQPRQYAITPAAVGCMPRLAGNSVRSGETGNRIVQGHG